MPMVSYQEYIAIAFSVAKEKGATFDGIDEGGDFISQAAVVWQQDKERIKQLTEKQTINYLEDKVSA